MKLSFCLLFLLSCVRLYADDDIERLLVRLDDVIEHQHEYDRIREGRIENLESLKAYVDSEDRLFRLYIDIAGEYAKYDTDLSLEYTYRALEIARALPDESLTGYALMTLAYINSMSGFQVEALELMNRVDKSRLAPEYVSTYYHTYRTIYGAIVSQIPAGDRHSVYRVKAECYRDSLKQRLGRDDVALLFVTTDEMIENGEEECRKAIDLLLAEYDKEGADDQTKAILAYSLGIANMKLGETEAAKRYLAVSAIKDLTQSLREYKSLQNLAFILFEQGDIDRAYTYINKAINDALKANVSVNMPFISRVIPVITEAYNERMKKKERQLNELLIFISVLLLLLLLTVLIISWQMRKANSAKKRERETNERLLIANGELTEMNEQLKRINASLAESNRIKDTYVGRYMDLCSDYIGKVDRYRVSLNRIARNEGTGEVIKALQSGQFLEDELRVFYENFDATFLHLFPDFVERFNALLRPEERIVLKPGKLLNSQLRVFALIRLGITDSVKIAEFMRYSVNTIYNYRVKMRNAAMNERDDFEIQVMRIGHNF